MMERDEFRDKADNLYLKLNDLMENDEFNYLEEFGRYSKATMVNGDIYG
ncbi:MAG: hypothetical protein GYA02_03045, partial [Clostridiaceae bacterium]|nr:hypothetical protein [Clostridiaceae bacterium]